MNSCVTTTSGSDASACCAATGHVVKAGGPEGAELQVAAFDPAELAQAGAQGFKIRRWLIRLPYAQPCDVSDLARLLGPRGKRPGCKRIGRGRAAEQRDDIATPHHPN